MAGKNIIEVSIRLDRFLPGSITIVLPLLWNDPNSLRIQPTSFSPAWLAVFALFSFSSPVPSGASGTYNLILATAFSMIVNWLQNDSVLSLNRCLSDLRSEIGGTYGWKKERTPLNIRRNALFLRKPRIRPR